MIICSIEMQKLRKRNSARGQAALMVTLSIIPTLGLLGLVVDVGWGFYRKEMCKTAAQAAATAAATVVANADITTCNAHNVTCQNATAVGSTSSCPVL
jgi:Flp pilus assembly protein TadG